MPPPPRRGEGATGTRPRRRKRIGRGAGVGDLVEHGDRVVAHAERGARGGELPTERRPSAGRAKSSAGKDAPAWRPSATIAGPSR